MDVGKYVCMNVCMNEQTYVCIFYVRARVRTCVFVCGYECV